MKTAESKLFIIISVMGIFCVFFAFVDAVKTVAELEAVCSGVLNGVWSSTTNSCIKAYSDPSQDYMNYTEAEAMCVSGAPNGSYGRLIHAVDRETLLILKAVSNQNRRYWIGARYWNQSRHSSLVSGSLPESIFEFAWMEGGQCTSPLNVTAFVNNDVVIQVALYSLGCMRSHFHSTHTNPYITTGSCDARDAARICEYYFTLSTYDCNLEQERPAVFYLKMDNAKYKHPYKTYPAGMYRGKLYCFKQCTLVQGCHAVNWNQKQLTCELADVAMKDMGADDFNSTIGWSYFEWENYLGTLFAPYN